VAEGIPARLTAAEGRRFAFVVGAAFLALAALTWWRGKETLTLVFAAAGALLILAGVALPGRLGPVYRGWMKFALVLSKITTPLFMSLVYFLLITPIALVLRLAGRNPLAHKPQGGSYWMSPPSGGRSDLTRQF